MLSIAEYNAESAYGTPTESSTDTKKSKAVSEKFKFAHEAFPYYNSTHYNKYVSYERQITGSNVETAQMLKRSKAVFKVIEPILKKHGIPDDFKYLAVLESGLNTDVTSSMRARGVWQLMSVTAQAMGLKVNSEVDERLDLEKSTIAVCKLLKKHKRFFGTWTEALVAFNMGNTALYRFQRAQNNYNDIYTLKMYTESAHVIYKVIAYKELFRNPAKYGYKVPSGSKGSALAARKSSLKPATHKMQVCSTGVQLVCSR